MIDEIISLSELIADIKQSREDGWCNTVDESDFVIDVIDLFEVFADYEMSVPEEWFGDIKRTVETLYGGYKLTYAGNTYNQNCPLSNNLTESIFTGADGIIYAVAVNLTRDAIGAYSGWVLFKFESRFELYELADYASKEIDFMYKDEFAYVEIYPFSDNSAVHVPALGVWFDTWSIDLDEIRAEIEEELSTP